MKWPLVALQIVGAFVGQKPATIFYSFADCQSQQFGKSRVLAVLGCCGHHWFHLVGFVGKEYMGCSQTLAIECHTCQLVWVAVGMCVWFCVCARGERRTVGSRTNPYVRIVPWCISTFNWTWQCGNLQMPKFNMSTITRHTQWWWLFHHPIKVIKSLDTQQ